MCVCFVFQFILYIQVISLMTLGINSYMMTHLARTLGKVYLTRKNNENRLLLEVGHFFWSSRN